MTRIINDNVFGTIPIDDYISVIIDTAQFQRLRFISRMGLIQFVYPSASHTVFMSSIGRYYLASKFVKKIQELDDREKICIKIAALCYDIGYIPFQYGWERISKELNWEFNNNRENFDEVWNKLIQNEKVKNKLEEYQLEPFHYDLIKCIVKGRKPESNNRDFLFQIVYNSESRMDIVLWERLCRDNIQLGHKSSNFLIEVKRYIKLSKIIDNKLCFRNKCFQSIIDAYRLWGYMHENAYRHRVVESIEQVLIEAFRNCSENERVLLNEYKSNSTTNIDGDFYKLIHEIKFNNENSIADKIFNRNLYKLEIEAFKLSNVTDDQKDQIKTDIHENANGNYNHICISFIDISKIISIDSVQKINIYDKYDPKKITEYPEHVFEEIGHNFTHTRILIYFKNPLTEHHIIIKKCQNTLKEDGWLLF